MCAPWSLRCLKECMFNSQAPLQLLDCTRPEVPCVVIPQTDAAVEDTAVLRGPMPPTVATTSPTHVIAALDKGDLPITGDDDVVAKSPSVTPVHIHLCNSSSIDAIRPLAMKQAVVEPGPSSGGTSQPIETPCAVEPTKPSSFGDPHPVKKGIERWPRDDRFPDFSPDNTTVSDRPFEAFRAMRNRRPEVTCPELRVQPNNPVYVSFLSVNKHITWSGGFPFPYLQFNVVCDIHLRIVLPSGWTIYANERGCALQPTPCV